ncbi:MAG: 4-hydroxy-3-methylbut-2-enyl diphosphate reductase [Pirellulaceae bacterium]|jgi:4-hydroxy-3-methylbut-2-enyl diphosphate reductase|nr:4-hydroxy-3-methylbut-2-enyl diphosphate reductase [Pirellulaceae bacterium]MDP7019227.1 4-hydroxy-3-methylbut-2-enyl diphosphate reductase [Pirellulaceae bacterium]
MKIVRAESMGMCFGVRDALAEATSQPNPSRVAIHGELVHNSHVLQQLDSLGLAQCPEESRAIAADRPLVMITAHGVSNAERERLERAGKTLIDTTCPLVQRVHDAAQRLSAEGRLVLVVGKRNHVEVRGIIEDLEHYAVVESADDVRDFNESQLGVICQSTTPPDLACDIWSHIQLHNPLADIAFIDTICDPTWQRQHALEALLPEVEAVVVVGGKNSNNTRRLVQFCHRHGRPALHVEGPDDVDPDWLCGVATVGLTAVRARSTRRLRLCTKNFKHSGAQSVIRHEADF